MKCISISFQMPGQNQESPVRVRDRTEPRVAISTLLSEAHRVQERYLSEEAKEGRRVTTSQV